MLYRLLGPRTRGRRLFGPLLLSTLLIGAMAVYVIPKLPPDTPAYVYFVFACIPCGWSAWNQTANMFMRKWFPRYRNSSPYIAAYEGAYDAIDNHRKDDWFDLIGIFIRILKMCTKLVIAVIIGPFALIIFLARFIIEVRRTSAYN